MDTVRNTCGSCSSSVPCNKILKGRGVDDMAASGWLACPLNQTTVEDRARYLSPNRAACSLFSPKN